MLFVSYRLIYTVPCIYRSCVSCIRTLYFQTLHRVFIPRFGTFGMFVHHVRNKNIVAKTIFVANCFLSYNLEESGKSHLKPNTKPNDKQIQIKIHNQAVRQCVKTAAAAVAAAAQ